MGETINLCMISPDFIPVWSGIGSYTISLLDGFPNHVRAQLVTIRRRIPASQGYVKLHNNSFDPILNRIRKKVKIHRVSDAQNNFLYHARFQVACVKAVPRICKRGKVDVIHTNFPLMSDILVKLLRRIKIPTIATVHSTIDGQHEGVKKAGMAINDLEQSDLANLLLYPTLKICELLYTRRVQYFIANSKNTREELRKYLGVSRKYIRVIYNGVDTEMFRPIDNIPPELCAAIPRKNPIVLFTGRFVATKGINVLLSAIPKVIKAYPSVLFLFVGGGNFSPYERILKRLGVRQRNFLHVGYIENFSNMPLIYSLATIYVAPTIYETLGLRILEAMSCGKPVVATNVGGIPEVIASGRNSVLFSCGDSEALSEAIMRLLSDKELYESISKEARKTVLEKFSKEKMVEQTVKLYQEIA